MSDWSLPALLSGLHDSVQQRLSTARATAGHPVLKGDASETVWLDLLTTYLPKRYYAARAVVVDSEGMFSDQIDVVVFDRQYSPFVFYQDGLAVIPAESVYAVFEAKQSANAEHIAYAQTKAESVRRLYRTSCPIPHAGGVHDPKALGPILAGLLTLESDWKPPLGDSLQKVVMDGGGDRRLNLGCVANHGIFATHPQSGYRVGLGDKAATAFLFELITQLQALATVPMIDIHAYARWLGTEAPAKRLTLEAFFTDAGK